MIIINTLYFYNMWYSAYFITILDNKFYNKYINSEGKYCFIFYNLKATTINYCSTILNIKNKFFSIYTYNYNDYDFFETSEIPKECSDEYDFIGFDLVDKLSSVIPISSLLSIFLYFLQQN